jgi:hypothetical protein
MGTEEKKPIEGLLIICASEARARTLTRIVGHLELTWLAVAESLKLADVVISRQAPEVLFVDLSDYTHNEYVGRVAPYVLGLPGHTKVFLIDPEPTIDKIIRASEMGATGILKSPMSHHAISTLMDQVRT